MLREVASKFLSVVMDKIGRIKDLCCLIDEGIVFEQDRPNES